MILIAGDSLTAGNIGIGFTEFLPEGSYLFRGIDGDTMRGVTSRTLRYIRQSKIRTQLRGIVLECGTNDVLLPYLLSSPLKLLRDSAHTLIRESSEPSGDSLEFYTIYRERLRAIIKETSGILETNQIAITTLPPIGEDLDHELQDLRKGHNTQIRRISEEFCLSLIDLEAAMLRLYRESPPFKESPYFMDDPGNFIIDARLIASDHRKALALTQKRGLNYTIDGLHFNANGARALAIPFSEFIETLN